MKALRDELLGRLNATRDERNSLTLRLKALEELEKAIDLIIKDEDFRTKATQLTLIQVKESNGHKVIGRTLLSQFLVKALADGQPKSLDQLAELAQVENIPFENKHPKRVLHFALIGLKHHDYARMVGQSVWQLTEKAITKHETTETKQELQTVDKEKAATVAGH